LGLPGNSTFPLPKPYIHSMETIARHVPVPPIAKWLVKYVLITALAIVFFDVVKKLAFTSAFGHDGYITAIATLFLITGAYVGTRLKGQHQPVENKVEDEPDLEQALSRRETEVLNLLLQDKTNKEIAAELYVEMSTLKSHINRIYKKLQVQNRRQLMQTFTQKQLD
jgi:DNA-binding CsgD family transcriptional regulator